MTMGDRIQPSHRKFTATAQETDDGVNLPRSAPVDPAGRGGAAKESSEPHIEQAAVTDTPR